MAQEQTYYQTSIDSCQCGETIHYTVAGKIRMSYSHQYALGAEKPKCPEVALILDEIPTDLVQDHKIIERIGRKQNDEHPERMKVITKTNIKKCSHFQQKEEIQEYLETDYRRGTRFTLGMPMLIFQLISDGIAKFAK
jgi:hypothetical protein